MTLPNFLVIGDIKAGSTSLYQYLRQHPDIYMPSELKELRYFAYDEHNPYHLRANASRVKTLDEYESYFATCKKEKAIGEASPNYLRSPIAAQKIRKTIPDAKLIVCLRNPAERLFSLYMMHYRTGRTKAPFDEELFGYDAAWIKANFYWSDLKRYFDRFDRVQIKVVLFDDLRSNSMDVAKQLYRFLGVADTFSPHISVGNRGGVPRNLVLYRFLIGAKNLIKGTGIMPVKFKQLWGDMRPRLMAHSEIEPQTRGNILEICRDDILRTGELINRDLSAWLK